MTKYIWHRPTKAFTCFTAFAMLGMICLGFWQISRLVWKEQFIATLEASNIKAPLTQLPQANEELAELGFRKAILLGEFLHQHEFHISPRSFRGKLGYHILTPFHMIDGRVILVNRGWVSTDEKEPKDRLGSQIEGALTLNLLLRTDKDYTDFTPPNNAEKNIWFYKDYAAMREHSGLKLLPLSGDAIGTPNREIRPVPLAGDIKIRNDHLQYVLTWFGIAVGIGMFYFFTHYRRETMETDND